MELIISFIGFDPPKQTYYRSYYQTINPFLIDAINLRDRYENRDGSGRE